MRPRNIDAAPKEVNHTALTRFGDGAYKSECPVCKEGILPMRRDSVEYALLSHDRCTNCGQAFVYLDAEVNGEPLKRVS